MTTKSPKTLVVTLKLSADSLTKFPHQPSPSPKEEAKPSPPTPTPQIVEPTPADTPADSTPNMDGSTPSSLAPPSAKKKGPKPGSKRSAAQMEAGSNGATTPKQPKAKPGPKRKKMGDIINDPNSKGPFTTPAAINKAGPKANLGAINERLRALDRTGAKCRRWEKKGFQVRSFTGVLWQVPTYQPGRGSAFADDVKSDSTGTSDSKLKDESSAISDKSGLNGDSASLHPAPPTIAMMNARRESWARVAAGSAGSGSSFHQPSRSAAFSHLANNNLTTNPTRLSRSIDADGHMSTSFGRAGGPLPSYSSQSGYWPGVGGPAQDIPPFFVPSYLRGSKHAEKLEDTHRAKVAAQREHKSTHSSNAGSLSTSSSSVNLHKMAPSHRGLAHEVIERASVLVDEPVAPWPTRWNDSDRFNQLELEDGGRMAKFSGTQKTHDEAAAVRADFPMPRQCGIYYYEITVISKGKDGRMIGIGFSGPKVALSRIPGWEPDSYAYHGDDGQVFSNTTSGKSYGPKFGTLDVIGCGINFRTNTAFFTKNGHLLGTAFRDLKPNMPYYPTVGMKKPGETVRVNFGQEPFAFDIDKMVEDEKATIQADIAQTKMETSAAGGEDALIHQLVGQYLAHDGYVETARAFSDEIVDEAKALANDEDADIPYRTAVEDLDALNRQKIRTAILEGDIDKALKHTAAYYPSVLRDNENIYFKLRCRKFIEMIRRCGELNAQCQPTPAAPSKRSAGSTQNKRNSTATEEYDFEMELDEQLGVHNPPPGWDNKDQDDELEDGDDDMEDREAKSARATDETIAYGMELKAEFANDPRREVKRALEDTFALIAYPDARESMLAPLLEVGGRVPVAEELNSAILVSLGKSSSAALERLVQQSEALVAELAEDGGYGAFINVRKDFLQ
ncbi:ran-binding protein [Stemphylium lycopersici]|nr:ran-binding protein [Stemphylium lycopersici]